MRNPFARNPVPKEDRPPHHGRTLLLRGALAMLLIFLLTAASVSSAVLLEVKNDVSIFVRNSQPLDPGVKDLLSNVEPGKPQTILIIGDDRRKAEVLGRNGKPIRHPPPTRSDTMILVHLDPSKGATAIMSMPRDLRVDIPGYGRQKLNAAFAFGEDKLALKTIHSLLGIPIHHYVRVTFWGFRGIVDRVGCVFTDVDRAYEHTNTPGTEQYAEIHVSAGYQKLCGQKALDYVRYRHGDSDVVRETRQQQFLSDARGQVGIGSLFTKRADLLKIFGRSVRTDIRSEKAILGLLKLLAKSSGKPLQPVHIDPLLDAPDGSGDLLASPEAIHAAAQRFLNVTANRGAKGRTKTVGRKARSAKRRSKASLAQIPSGLFLNKRPGEDDAARLSLKTGPALPVYYAKLMPSRGNYRTSDNRVYTIVDRAGKKHKAYRIVGFQGTDGQYYGIQGTTWKSPPILDDPDETRRMAGRRYRLYYDGSRLRLVSWETPRGVYWVSNTLLRSLSNPQMLALARSLTRVGT